MVRSVVRALSCFKTSDCETKVLYCKKKTTVMSAISNNIYTFLFVRNFFIVIPGYITPSRLYKKISVLATDFPYFTQILLIKLRQTDMIFLSEHGQGGII